MLSLPLQDIHEAWQYWVKTGLVVKHPHNEGQDYDIEFLSLRSLYIQNNFNNKNQANSNVKNLKSSNQNAFRIENENFVKLTKSVEKIIGHPLSYAEYRDIGDYFENYSKDHDFIVKAFEHCFIERNIRNFKIVKTTLLSWIDQGFTTKDQVEVHLSQSNERSQIYRDVLKLLGISYRLPNQGEKDLIDKWIDSYAILPGDMYDIIKDLSKKTLNISFNYIDKAISTLAGQGVKTFSEYQVKNQKDKADFKPQSKRRNYTIEKEKTYSEEELENILLNKNK
jgi:DnaD/phage-associated family protein